MHCCYHVYCSLMHEEQETDVKSHISRKPSIILEKHDIKDLSLTLPLST